MYKVIHIFLSGGTLMRLKQNGFSLVEVMIAMGLFAVLIGGTAAFFNSMSKTNRSIKQSSEFNGISNLLHLMLSDKAKCSSALVTAANAKVTVSSTSSSNPTSVSKIRFNTDDFMAVNQVKDGLQITSLELTPYQTINAASQEYIMYLNISANKTGVDTSVGGDLVTRSIPLFVKLNSAVPSQMAECSTTQAGDDSGSGGFDSWDTTKTINSENFADKDSLVMATSCWNCALEGQTGPGNATCTGVTWTRRLYVNQRDKYGQGLISGTMPVKKGECWRMLSGAGSTVNVMKMK